MSRFWILWFLLIFSSAVCAQKPVAFVPDDPDTVIERLPRGYAALSTLNVAATSVQASSAPVTRIAQARALYAAAARSGDARLAARADALMVAFPADDRNPDVLRLRAFGAQHRHAFAEAGQWLDRLIAADPRAGDARLSQAQLHLIGGRLTAARADCVALALGIDADDGLLCVAMLSLRQGRYPAAAAATERWLKQPAQHPQADRERLRYALVLRGEIAARAGDPAAENHFRRALTLAPEDVRTLSAYARGLRRLGRARAVEALLRDVGAHDGLRLQRALAMREYAPDAAEALAAELGRGFALAHRLGRAPEARDEAEYLLSFGRDPQAALTLARRNFAEQRDEEDVDLLYRAATAARRPEVLRELRAWASAQGVPLPREMRR